MATAEQKNIIDCAITALRAKKAARKEDVATLDEVTEFIPNTDSFARRAMLHPDFVNELYEAIKNNGKLHFDPVRCKFTFKHRFIDSNALMLKLYEDKCGVEEDQNLYDDIRQQEIQKLKASGMLRVIEIKPKKKASALQTFLFSKNHSEPIDEANIEEKTTQFLKDKWAEIDREVHENDKPSRHSNFVYINRNQPALPRTAPLEKRKRKSKEEENPHLWLNRHISFEISQALNRIKEAASKEKLKKLKAT